jgi:hypothetical protein
MGRACETSSEMCPVLRFGGVQLRVSAVIVLIGYINTLPQRYTVPKRYLYKFTFL